jgi:hypothetical protein
MKYSTHDGDDGDEESHVKQGARLVRRLIDDIPEIKFRWKVRHRVAPPGATRAELLRVLPSRRPALRLTSARVAAGSPCGCKEGGGGAPAPLSFSFPPLVLSGWMTCPWRRRRPRLPVAGSASCAAGSTPAATGSALPGPRRDGSRWWRRRRPRHGGLRLRLKLRPRPRASVATAWAGRVVAAAAPSADA